MKRTAAVVVTFNRKVMLKECLESLLSQTVKEFDVIVVDNDSSDGTSDLVNSYKKKTSRVQYLNTGGNIGGAGGFNYGIRYAVENEYDYIWVMDDDCIPHRDALEELLYADSELNGDYGFFSSKVLWIDGKMCSMNYSRDHFFRKIKKVKNKYTDVSASSFVSMFTKRSIIEKIGLPIKDFFVWSDDWEFTKRISRKYPCYLVKDSVVVHKCKYNIGGDISRDTDDRIGRYRFLYRNEMYTFKQDGLKGVIFEYIRIMVHSCRVIFKKGTKKRKKLSIMWRSALEGLHYHPQIESIGEK